jgi:hypothetical protein
VLSNCCTKLKSYCIQDDRTAALVCEWPALNVIYIEIRADCSAVGKSQLTAEFKCHLHRVWYSVVIMRTTLK